VQAIVGRATQPPQLRRFNKLADWSMYLSLVATRIIPLIATTFMRVVGLVEIAAGLMVLSRWTRVGSYVVTLWLPVRLSSEVD
jgi:hypothetical protein